MYFLSCEEIKTFIIITIHQDLHHLLLCYKLITVINEVEYCGQKSENSLEAAEIFNTFFSEIGTNPSKDVAETEVSYSDFLTETDKLFSFCETTPAHVYSLLSKLSKSKATVPDNIPAKLLKECPELICESLSLIFNQSFKTGVFPNDWKNARVSPLYKNSGKRYDPSNYRPISVIPVVAKVFEQIIYDQLYVYLTKYIFFPNISPVSVHYTRRLRLYSRQPIAGLLI